MLGIGLRGLGIGQVHGSSVGPIYQSQVDYLAKLLSYNPIACFPLDETSGTVADNAQGTATLDAAYSADRSGWTLADGPFGEVGKAGLFGPQIANLYTEALAAAYTPDELTVILWVKPADAGVWADGVTRYLLELRASSTNFLDFQKNQTSGQFWRRRAGGVTSDLNNAGNAWADWKQLGMAVSASANKFQPYQDGATVFDMAATAAGAWSGALLSTQAVLGALNTSKGSPANHYMMYAALFPAALSQIQMADLASTYNVITPRTAWTKVFEDHFTGALDTTSWTAADETTGNLNAYKPDHVTQSGSDLVLTVTDDAYLGKDYTSGKITTLGKLSWTYGRFEMRAKLCGGKGIHPAFWMMPVTATYGDWPLSGEIDIMEMSGNHITQVQGGVHAGADGPGLNSANTASHIYTLPSGDFTDDYHVFACDWTPYAFYFYVDGVLTSMQSRWYTSGGAWPAPFDKPFQLMVTLAVGTFDGGPPDGTVTFPLSMLVDYVRVYQ